ncbi:MAG: hypothetical protein EA397_07265 [Deltaproteobacteria bacterium]|nr:MAG: hypothetical protein EA397_07265 [Deltaproteobacteria bacterium]
MDPWRWPPATAALLALAACGSHQEPFHRDPFFEGYDLVGRVLFKTSPDLEASRPSIPRAYACDFEVYLRGTGREESPQDLEWRYDYESFIQEDRSSQSCELSPTHAVYALLTGETFERGELDLMRALNTDSDGLGLITTLYTGHGPVYVGVSFAEAFPDMDFDYDGGRLSSAGPIAFDLEYDIERNLEVDLSLQLLVGEDGETVTGTSSYLRAEDGSSQCDIQTTLQGRKDRPSNERTVFTLRSELGHDHSTEDCTDISKLYALHPDYEPQEFELTYRHLEQDFLIRRGDHTILLHRRTHELREGLWTFDLAMGPVVTVPQSERIVLERELELIRNDAYGGWEP